jgi:hypothetical protein
MLHPADWKMVTEVSKNYIAFIFRVKEAATRRDVAEDLNLHVLNSLSNGWPLHDLVLEWMAAGIITAAYNLT